MALRYPISTETDKAFSQSLMLALAGWAKTSEAAKYVIGYAANGMYAPGTPEDRTPRVPVSLEADMEAAPYYEAFIALWKHHYLGE